MAWLMHVLLTCADNVTGMPTQRNTNRVHVVAVKSGQVKQVSMLSNHRHVQTLDNKRVRLFLLLVVDNDSETSSASAINKAHTNSDSHKTNGSINK